MHERYTKTLFAVVAKSGDSMLDWEWGNVDLGEVNGTAGMHSKVR